MISFTRPISTLHLVQLCTTHLPLEKPSLQHRIPSNKHCQNPDDCIRVDVVTWLLQFTQKIREGIVPRVLVPGNSKNSVPVNSVSSVGPVGLRDPGKCPWKVLALLFPFPAIEGGNTMVA